MKLTPDQRTAALATFAEYFVKNYPGPHTIIGDPNWHAPKVFRAALHAIESESAPGRFTENELKWLEGNPDALRLVAEYNDAQESQADSMGADSCAEHHNARRHELVTEAQRIEEKWTGPITRIENLTSVVNPQGDSDGHR